MALPAVTELLRFLNGIASVGGGQFPTTGNVRFVGSTSAGSANDSSHGLSSDTPWKSLAFAATQVTANQGDLIVLMPGHQETIMGAAGVALATAGLSVIGLGVGRNRPVLSFTASTSADLRVNAASIALANLVFDLTGIDGVQVGLRIGAADCTLFECEFIVASAIAQAARAIQTDGNAHRLRIHGCHFFGGSTAGSVATIDLAGSPDAVEIVDCGIVGLVTRGLIDNAAANLATNLLVQNCRLVSLDATPCINLDSAVTGLLADNRLVSTDPATALDPGACACEGNLAYDSDTPDQDGMPVPASGTSLAFGRSLADELRGASLNYGRLGFLEVTTDFTDIAWNTVGSHELLTVTGLVRLRIVPVVIGSLTSGGLATLQLGIEGGTNAFIGATAFSDLTLDCIWNSLLKQMQGTDLTDRYVNQADVGFEIATAALTGGSIRYSVWWEALSSDGSVVAGTGGSL